MASERRKIASEVSTVAELRAMASRMRRTVLAMTLRAGLMVLMSDPACLLLTFAQSCMEE